MNKGGVFIISGPSGSGKDTLLVELFRRRPELRFSISCITRPMRQGETEGEKYHFISRDEFEGMIEARALLEYNVYVNNYYGTPKAPVEEAVDAGLNMVIEVDVNGAAQIRANRPDAVSIFIMPPSYEELKRRLRGRGTESENVIEQRMNAAMDEIKRASEYDYIIVNNVIDTAVDDIISVIDASGLKTDRQRHIINEVLEKC